ncbi:MAG: YdeI/OmpD-associated family protein [Saprospiraceae bacterium]
MQKKLYYDAAFKTAFKAFSPRRQHSYILHFSSAKQSATREARIENSTPQILESKELNE